MTGFLIALYALRPRALSNTVSCIVDRALDALVARTWIGYRLGQSRFI